MLDKELTIIIGAGANKEIHSEISTGIELIQDISDRVTDRTKPDGPSLSNAFAIFNDLGLDIRIQFLSHLDRYMESVVSPSIDAFLNEIETFPEFAAIQERFGRIGRLLILAHVVGWEGTTTIKYIGEEVKEKRRTWLSVLSDFIDKHNAFSGSRLKIITFNYDRILEKFLHDKYPRDKKRVRQFVKECVHHVYGRYANYPGLEPIGGEATVDFDEIKNHEFEKLIRHVNNIKLIREPKDTTRIKDIVASSKRLIMMGYGLDSINNSRLGLHRFQQDDRDLIFNIYPGPQPNYQFESRRRLAELVRNVRVDADIQYMTCTNFLEYALNRPWN